MTFAKWWDKIGQRKEYFSALEAAQAGWLAHKLHADTWPDHGVIEEEPLLLKDRKSKSTREVGIRGNGHRNDCMCEDCGIAGYKDRLPVVPPKGRSV